MGVRGGIPSFSVDPVPRRATPSGPSVGGFQPSAPMPAVTLLLGGFWLAFGAGGSQVPLQAPGFAASGRGADNSDVNWHRPVVR